MASLNENTKSLIVKELACYNSPSEIQKELRNIFEIDVSLSQIVYYNPETARSANLAEKWRSLFYNLRRKFVEGVIDIPISNKQYRLLELQKTLQHCKKEKNWVRVLQTIEQAAKEVGGMYEQNKPLPPGSGDSTNFYQQIIDLNKRRRKKDKISKKSIG